MEDTESHGMTHLMAWQCDVAKLHDVSLSLVWRVLLGLGFRKISLISATYLKVPMTLKKVNLLRILCDKLLYIKGYMHDGKDWTWCLCPAGKRENGTSLERLLLWQLIQSQQCQACCLAGLAIQLAWGCPICWLLWWELSQRWHYPCLQYHILLHVQQCQTMQL